MSTCASNILTISGDIHMCIKQRIYTSHSLNMLLWGAESWNLMKIVHTWSWVSAGER